MADQMEVLTAKWVRWIEYRNAIDQYRDAVEEQVIDWIVKNDRRFADDESSRKMALKELQQSFYRVALAEMLERNSASKDPPKKVLEKAKEILAKRGFRPSERPAPKDMRSSEEEKYYGSLRVRWSNLLKKAEVQAADNRGGDTSYLRIR